MMDIQNNNRPKFSPEISLGSVLSIISIVASALAVSAYANRIDSKTDANAIRIYALEERLNRDTATAIERKRDDNTRLDRIELKLDQVRQDVQQRSWRTQ